MCKKIRLFLAKCKKYIGSFSVKTERHLDYFNTISKLSDDNFDDFYLLMRKQLERLKNGLLQDYCHDKREIKQVKLAIKLLDIIMEDDGARLKYRDRPIIIKNDNGEYIANPDNEWIFDKYVNTRNRKRFIGLMEIEKPLSGIYKSYLYHVKVKNLFYEYLKNYSSNWWVL